MKSLNTFDLGYLPGLATIDFSKAHFCSLEILSIHHMTLLSLIQIGEKALTICDQLSLRSLPSLNCVAGIPAHSSIFSSLTSLTITDAPSLRSSNLRFNLRGFDSLKSLRCDDSSLYRSLIIPINRDIAPLFITSPSVQSLYYSTSITVNTLLTMDISQYFKVSMCPFLMSVTISVYSGRAGMCLSLQSFSMLKEFTVKQNSLNEISSLHLNDLPILETITIESHCCMNSNECIFSSIVYMPLSMQIFPLSKTLI